MDTANKVARLANERGLGLVGVGVPKTIDNDVGDSEFKLIDHTPGYGSTARYWAHMVQFANEENAGSSPADPGAGAAGDGTKNRLYSRRRPPGRSAARAAAANLSGRAAGHARADGRQRQRLLRRAGRAIVVVSEGLQVGGHRRKKGFVRPHAIQLQPTDRGAGRHQRTQRKGPAGQRGGPRERARHRSATQHDLRVDRRSRRGVSRRPNGGRTGGRRDERLHVDHPSRAGNDLSTSATTKCRWRKSPTASGPSRANWITPDGTDVTDDFVRYARPLIGDDWPSIPLVDGRIRLARLDRSLPVRNWPNMSPRRTGNNSTRGVRACQFLC